MVLQDVQGAVYSELDIPLHDGAKLQAMDCVDQRSAADRALHRLFLLLLPGMEEQQEAAAPSLVCNSKFYACVATLAAWECRCMMY